MSQIQKKKQEEVIIPEDLQELEQEIIEINPSAFKGINENKKLELLQVMDTFYMKATSHSGPLPDAESLAKYNNTIPNGADRIMSMAEKQSEHRISIEKSVVSTNNFSTILGQIFGFLIGILGISSSIYLAMNNHDTIAGILVGGTLVSLVGIFVIGKYIQKKD